MGKILVGLTMRTGTIDIPVRLGSTFTAVWSERTPRSRCRFRGPETSAAGRARSANAQGTIDALQDQGYTVVVHNPRGVSLEQATVVAVRSGPEMVDRIRDREGNWDSTVTQSIVFVDVA